MTLRHLKIFLAVYQTENITRAAEQLHMTQPAVTRAIREMEDYYGVQLFDRINHRISISEIGKAFYASALHIVSSFDQLEKGVRDWDTVGVLRMGTTVTIGYSLLPDVLADFGQEFPNLQLRPTVTYGAQLQQALLDNQLDFAIIEGPVDNEQLYQERIASDCMVVVMPPDDPRLQWKELLLEDIKDGPFILGDSQSAMRNFINYVFLAHGYPIAPMMETICTMSTIQAVHKGIGISFLPELMVRSSVEAGLVGTHKIANESFRREIYAVWHKHKLLTASARKMIDRFRHLAEIQME